MLKKFLIGTVVALALLVGVSASAAYDFGTTTLKVGSKGAAVMAVQTVVGASVDGSFGPMTAAKVKVWQAANGLTADGLFGNASKAKANAGATVGTYPAGCTSAVGYSSTTGAKCDSTVGTYPAGCTSAVGYSSTTGAKCDGSTGGVVSGPLTGSAGTLTPTLSSALSGESVGEAAVDTQVYGLKLKADSGSDVQISAVKLVFVKTGAAGTHSKLQYYAKDVSVWLDGVKYASVAGNSFTSDNSYTQTLSLSSGAIIRKNATGNLVVAVSGVDSLDSGDAGKTWSVEATMVRYMDAQGAVISDSISKGTRPLTFDKFATASSLELKTSVSTDSPKEGIVTGKSADTFDATLLRFTLKAKGSDVTVNKLPVLLTTTTHGTGVLATQATLSWSGGSDSQDVNGSGTTESVLFGDTSDLGIKITDGSSVTFTVTTKMAKLVTANEGDTMKADVTTLSMQTVDETGADITQSVTYLPGSANGDKQHLYTIAPTISVISTSIVPVDNGSTASSAALAKIKVQVTANGGDIYLNGAGTSTPTLAFAQLLRDGGSASDTIGSITYAPTGTYTTTGSGATEYYTIADGNSMTIEISAVVSQAAGAGTQLVGMKASSLLFGTASTSEATRSASSMSWTALTDILKTGQTALKS